MSCYLCKSDEYSKRKGTVRDNPDIDILECGGCGLVYLSSLNHIQDGHYEESGMHKDQVPDIDNWLRDSEFDDKRRYEFVKEKTTNKTLLDFGCGIGGFLDLAKKSASSVSGIELEKALQPSFKRRGLDVFESLSAAQKENKKYDIITAFHVVEHLHDPAGILSELSQSLTRGAR